MSNEYTTLRLPKELVNEIDKIVGKHGFTSRAEVAKEAIRALLKEYEQRKEA
jgi:metal-responsive CopG/Arc/MetJ family transcriptional regulator